MEGERIDYIAMKVMAWRTDDSRLRYGLWHLPPYSVGEAPALHGKKSPAS